MPLTDYYASHRSRWGQDIGLIRSMFDMDASWQQRAFQATYRIIPNGWFDLAKADETKRKIEMLRCLDPASRRVNPRPDPEKSPDPAIRWLDYILPDLNFTKDIVKRVSYMQVQLDEAEIACRLERYYLAHQAYPATVADLTLINGPLPHDLIGGQPYHYVLSAPQKYLIYSVGWNQADDHGDAGPYHNSDSPDWVWTSYPNQK